METVADKTFDNETVNVDGKAFSGCTFNYCTLVYSAGDVPTFTNCDFGSNTLQFEGAAQNTLKFLSTLQTGGFERSVETIFQTIRGGAS